MVDSFNRKEEVPRVKVECDANAPLDSKTDEIVENFGLFDQDIEEDRDQTLVLLMELRKFRRENGAAFRRIRNLPLRCRLGRSRPDLADGTIVYIRNERHNTFYRVSQSGELDELGFLEAAAIFRAAADEKALPLPPHHHDQHSRSELTHSIGQIKFSP